MTHPIIENLKSTLLEQQTLCGKILDCAEKEHDLLRGEPEPDWADISISKKKMLAQLGISLDNVKNQRLQWARLEKSERQSCPDIIDLMHRNQNLIMKVIVLDRQNEELFLKKGHIPPGLMPSINRQRPQHVASLYSRNHSIGLNQCQ